MPTTLTEAPSRSAVETAPRGALHELQLRRLRTALARREVAVPVDALDDLRLVPAPPVPRATPFVSPITNHPLPKESPHVPQRILGGLAVTVAALAIAAPAHAQEVIPPAQPSTPDRHPDPDPDPDPDRRRRRPVHLARAAGRPERDDRLRQKCHVARSRHGYTYAVCSVQADARALRPDREHQLPLEPAHVQAAHERQVGRHDRHDLAVQRQRLRRAGQRAPTVLQARLQGQDGRAGPPRSSSSAATGSTGAGDHPADRRRADGHAVADRLDGRRRPVRRPPAPRPGGGVRRPRGLPDLVPGHPHERAHDAQRALVAGRDRDPRRARPSPRVGDRADAAVGLPRLLRAAGGAVVAPRRDRLRRRRRLHARRVRPLGAPRRRLLGRARAARPSTP